jgi:putative SOS response-associated peptidase YedK
MLFAGLYESWHPERNKARGHVHDRDVRSECVIGEIHDRMPVILDERAAEDWMNPREENPLSLKRLLVPAPSELLVMQPASPLANSVMNEGPALLEL